MSTTKATPAPATIRLQIRTNPDLHALVKLVASLQKRTMSDFVAAAVDQAAHQAIAQAETSQNTSQNRL